LQSLELQRNLKHALLNSYHGAGDNPGNHAVLLDLADKSGLDHAGAAGVINSDLYSNEVRAEEKFWQQAGIQSIPSIIINEKHLITGGQAPEVFEQILREVSAQIEPEAS